MLKTYGEKIQYSHLYLPLPQHWQVRRHLGCLRQAARLGAGAVGRVIQDRSCDTKIFYKMFACLCSP